MLIRWLERLPLYYETEEQIFVRAGIDEEAEEYWRHGTPDDYFVQKYPASFGKFYKDIIAGHISTSSLAGDEEFHHVYWDGKSHFYIDGNTVKSGYVPVLRYNTKTSRYSSFTKKIDCYGKLEWEEYFIR